jgi:hypothetical protein
MALSRTILSMTLRNFLGALLALSSSAVAQTDSTPQGRPAREILDSLKVGRLRWARAQVVEYRIQSHADCFCIYRPDAFARQLPLLTIRQDSIIAREKGKRGTPPSPEFTITNLFDRIEEDASSDARIIDQLELNPVYGFPIRYKAHDPLIPDAWLQLQVDSFAVVRRARD